MMNAYDKDYLYHAQKNFAHMIDFAVNTCDFELDEFFRMFLASNVCYQYEIGNPAYIAGKSGCELARLVVSEIKNQEIEQEDIMYLDKSPEYWLGWALAYYTWLKNCRFSYVLNAVPAEELIGMYDTLHEADISRFVTNVDSRLSEYYTQTALARIRNQCGLSQVDLAERSGINLRVIQSYEQRLRDINKAQMATVVRLAWVLECSPVDLMEKGQKKLL